jgi:hypothetical protein
MRPETTAEGGCSLIDVDSHWSRFRLGARYCRASGVLEGVLPRRALLSIVKPNETLDMHPRDLALARALAVLVQPQAFPLTVVLDACEVAGEELACRIVVQRGVQVASFQDWRVIERSTRPRERLVRIAPPRIPSRRGPRDRAPRAHPVRRRATVASRDRDGPSSDDDPPDLNALRGFRAASNRMYVHVGRRMAAARTA